MGTYRELDDIAQQYGSPFYLFDEESFIRNFQDIRSAFEKRYPRVVIGYSYKTNYIPYLCRLVKDLGGYAEVVSRLELDLALRIGCPPAQIIYNGPVKMAEDIALALDSGILVNIDTLREFEFVTLIARQAPEKVIRIGLRINIGLVDSMGKSQLQDGLPSSRFGFSDDTLKSVVHQLRSLPNVHVCSLHGHTSSSTRNLWAYREIANRLATVGGQYFPGSVEFINVGGGFYGRPVPAMGFAETPTFDDYAEAITNVLGDYSWIKAMQPKLVIEPGMAVVADTLSFITRVFEVKRSGDQQFAVVDGSVFNVKPTLHQRNHPFSVVRKNLGPAPGGHFSIVGATCMEKDRLLTGINCMEVERGDFIRIENVGAYTVVLTPPFINPAPPVLVNGPEGYMVIRRRQNFNDFFGTYLF